MTWRGPTNRSMLTDEEVGRFVRTTAMLRAWEARPPRAPRTPRAGADSGNPPPPVETAPAQGARRGAA